MAYSKPHHLNVNTTGYTTVAKTLKPQVPTYLQRALPSKGAASIGDLSDE